MHFNLYERWVSCFQLKLIQCYRFSASMMTSSPKAIPEQGGHNERDVNDSSRGFPGGLPAIHP